MKKNRQMKKKFGQNRPICPNCQENGVFARPEGGKSRKKKQNRTLHTGLAAAAVLK
jgi:hypothetical protein